MSDDPRKAKTLGEACANGDGTYNGARLLSWLSAAVSGGNGFSEAEVKEIWNDAKRRVDARKRGEA